MQLFEVGRIFISKGQDTQPDEVEKLGGTINRTDEPYRLVRFSCTCRFLCAKGILDSIFEKLGILDNINYIPVEGYPEMHPGRTADIALGESRIGFVGELHPKYEKDHDLNQTVVFEVNLDELLDLKLGSIEYEVLPKYPSIENVLVADRDVPVSTLSILSKVQRRVSGRMCLM